MRKPATQHPEVPDALIEALETVLARLWQGEFYDYYHGGGDAEPDQEEHCFLELEVIRHWLDYAEEDCGRG
jgi:hypothetical protein